MFMKMWENSHDGPMVCIMAFGLGHIFRERTPDFYARYGLQSLVAGIGDLPVGAFCQGVKQWIWFIFVANI